MIILVITCIPTLLIGIGINWVGARQVEKSVTASRNTEVLLSSGRIDDFLSHLEKAATQWAFSPEFGVELINLEANYDYEHIRKIFKTLLLIKGSNPLIEQAYLYLDSTGTLFSEDGGAVQLNHDPKHQGLQHLLRSPKSTYWINTSSSNRNEGEEQTVLVYQLPIDMAEPFALLLITLNKDQVSQLVGTMSPEGGSILVAEDGLPIAAAARTESSSYMEDDLREAVSSRQLHQPGKSVEHFVYKRENVKYFVSYRTFNRLGQTWTYITTVSLSTLTAPVVFVSRMMYIFSLGGLLTAIVVSLIASRKLYQPIRYLLNLLHIERRPASSEDGANEIELIAKRWQQLQLERSTLQERLQQHLPVMREGFLLQLLQGHFYSLHELELQQRMEQFGWTVGRHEFAILVIQLSGLAKPSGKFHEGDRQLISFAAANIVGEVGKKLFSQAEAINFQDLTVGLFLIYPEQKAGEQSRGELYQLAQQLINNLADILRMEVTVSVSRSVSSVNCIPTIFEDTRNVLRYRNMNGANQILDAAEYLQQGDTRLPYPFTLEQSLFQAIRAAREGEAIRLLEQFCNHLIHSSGKEFLFQQGVQQLLGNLQFGFLKAGYNPYAHHSAVNLYEELSLLKELQEVVAWFREKIIQPFIREAVALSEAQDKKADPFVDEVVHFMNSNYRDTNMSLELCADTHGISPLALSRAFKKGTGLNFIDYLTQIRLNKSKELLMNSNTKINEIAEQVGYQTTYFNRIFKKHEGVTPGQYRELHEPDSSVKQKVIHKGDKNE